MKEKKNIDRLFQEKFKDFEAHPSDAVWDKIALAKAEKENRKVIPLWWRLGGIAAALALLIGLGSLFFSPPESESTIVDTTETPASKTQDENLSNPIEQVAQEESSNEELNTDDDQNNKTDEGIANNTNSQSKNTINNYNSTAPTNNAVVSQNKNIQDKNSSAQKGNFVVQNNVNKNTAITSNDKTSVKKGNAQSSTSNDTRNNNSTNSNSAIPQDNVTTAVAASNNESIKDGEEKSLIDVAQGIEDSKQDEAITVTDDLSNNRRWDVGAVAAPVYYGDFGGSGIDPQFNDNSKNGDVNLSYGVQVSYAVSKKLKVRTGVSNVDLSYGTNDISFSPDISASRLSGVDYNNARFISVTDQVSNSDQLPIAEADNFQGGTTVSNGSLQQSVGYIEVPVEAVYTISDKRLGVEVIGGMSTLFLNDNEIAIQSQDGLRTPIGESNSLNEVSFTTNVGVGVNYKVTDKVKVNVEPTLKYQLNAFEGAAGDFKPYYIGLYTGVSYRF